MPPCPSACHPSCTKNMQLSRSAKNFHSRRTSKIPPPISSCHYQQKSRPIAAHTTYPSLPNTTGDAPNHLYSTLVLLGTAIQSCCICNRHTQNNALPSWLKLKNKQQSTTPDSSCQSNSGKHNISNSNHSNRKHSNSRDDNSISVAKKQLTA